MADGQFDKDFGYLMPFLDKVAAAASALNDPAASEELARLMTDEKTRWARIRQLLSGAQPKPAARPAIKATAERTASTVESNATNKEVATFTVGSLRPNKT